MATRKDVAQLAGVSPTSVSYYVNNSGYVSVDKQLRIQKAIDELNYRPNLLARSLKVQKTNQLLLVCNEIRNPFHAELVYYTTKYAYENDYIMLFANVQDDAEYIEKICDYQINGIIVASNKISEEKLAEISKLDIPIVAIINMDMNNLSDNITHIKVDSIPAIENIVDIIIENGHSKLAFISSCPSKDRRMVEGKTRGFIDRTRKHGLYECEDNIVYNVTSSLAAYDVTKKLISEKELTAIICANDAVAIGAIRAVHEAGLRVPEDVVVTGFDNSDSSMTSIPSLTTIDVSVKHISELTIEAIIKRINGESIEDMLITTKLIRRESM